MSKTYQTIMEAFNNPKVRDMEFDSMVEDIRIVEKGVNSFKTFLLNYNNFFQSIKTFSTEMNTVTRQLFEKSSPYVILIDEIEEAHNKIEKFYEDFNKKLLEILIPAVGVCIVGGAVIYLNFKPEMVVEVIGLASISR